jgi:hypothetical protein
MLGVATPGVHLNAGTGAGAFGRGAMRWVEGAAYDRRPRLRTARIDRSFMVVLAS